MLLKGIREKINLSYHSDISFWARHIKLWNLGVVLFCLRLFDCNVYHVTMLFFKYIDELNWLFCLYILLCKLWLITIILAWWLFELVHWKLYVCANILAGLAADSMFDSKSLSKRRDLYSEEAISFSEVDIITPAHKMLARQLTCDIRPGESLLVTG